MLRPTEDRGVVVPIFVLILVGFLIIGVSLNQAVVVPNQNEAVEAEHSQQVTEEMDALIDGVWALRRGEASGSQQLSLGTGYPSRTFAVNAAPARGRVQTVALGTYAISGPGVDEDLSTICAGGSTTATALVYQPDYRYVESSSEFFAENGLSYRQFDSAQVVTHPEFRNSARQGLVRGSDVWLVPTTGALSVERQGQVAIDYTAGELTTVSLDQPVTLTIPTRLSEEAWRDQTDLTAQSAFGTFESSGTDEIQVRLEATPAAPLRVHCLPTTYSTTES